jgi:hypothetical protein
VVVDHLQSLELVAIDDPLPAQETWCDRSACVGDVSAVADRRRPRQRDLLSAVDRPDEDRAVRHDILGKVLASELSMSNSNDHWNKQTGVPDSILAS